MTAFFIPGHPPEDTERVYAGLAAMCRCSPAPVDQRVRKIKFVHDGEEWIAEIGEQLRGRPLRGRLATPPGAPPYFRYADPAVALAIFPGKPFLVATSKGVDGTRSRWANPFLVGNPVDVEYFDPPDDLPEQSEQ